MKITENLLTKGNTHGRAGAKMTPKGIVVHYVGNPSSTAAGNRNWFENGAGGAYTSAHYIVGLDGEILLIVPENECAQHAGKAYGAQWTEQAKKNNGMYIGIETCHPDSTGKFNGKTYASLVWLCADICKRYGLNPVKDIFRHYDVTGKACPLYYVNNGAAWDQFLKDVEAAMKPVSQPEFKPSPKQETVSFDLFGEKKVDVPGYLKEGHNYVQVRPLLEAMGFFAGWENGTVTVRVKRQLSAEDYTCMCKIVEAEAGGEDEKGKILVANVIFNRMADKGFPNSLQEVVFQNKVENGMTTYQFSPIGNTAYDKAVPSAATKLAVDKALAGVDYSQGATFFRTIKGADRGWHETALTRLMDHGGHRFYK